MVWRYSPSADGKAKEIVTISTVIFFLEKLPYAGDNNLWQNAIMTIWDFPAMLDSAYLQAAIKMKEKHTYKIRQDKDGRWSTYVKKEGEKRKLIRKPTKEKLEEALIIFYEEEEKKRTFEAVYLEWRTFHDKLVTNNTISKYNSDKIRYCEQKEFVNMPIEKITEDDVQVFIKETIDELKLCQSAAKSLFNYMKDAFEYGMRREYIVKNPMVFLSAKEFYRFTYKSNRYSRNKTISDEKEALLLERYEEDLAMDPNYIPTYAVYLSAYTGLRAGELAGLKWEDDHGNYILVSRSQKYDPFEKKYYIDGTKNGLERVVPVTKPTRKLLDRLKKVNGESVYMFGSGDKPTTFRVICSCIKNKCRQVGIETYGIHANRRTVNSKMAKAGVPVTMRAALLGHSEEVNEKYYTFDIANLGEKLDAMAKVNTRMNTNQGPLVKKP